MDTTNVLSALAKKAKSNPEHASVISKISKMIEEGDDSLSKDNTKIKLLSSIIEDMN